MQKIILGTEINKIETVNIQTKLWVFDKIKNVDKVLYELLKDRERKLPN